jgi:hypothetical protein
MISHYNQIEENLSWIKNSLSHFQSTPMIQKIYATPYYLAISVRTPGKTYWILQGRGQGHEGLWMTPTPPPSAWRVNDRLLEFYRKRLSSSSLIDLRLDANDRLIHWDYQKWGALNTLSYYWQGRLSYLGACYWDTDRQGFKLYFSWDNKSMLVKSTYESREEAMEIYASKWRELGLADMKETKATPSQPQVDIEEALIKAHATEKMNPSVKKQLKSKERKLELFKKDLARVEQIHLIKNFLNKNTPIPDQLVIGDHQFKFTEGQKEFQRRDLMFQKIKRLAAAAKIIQEKMQKLESGEVESNKFNKSDKGKEVILLKSIFPVTHLKNDPLENQADAKSPSAQKSKMTDYRIISEAGFDLAIGETATGNDRMRKEWANKEDWWFHAAQGTSPHLILKFKNKSTQLLAPEILQRVGSYLCQLLKVSEIDFIYTKVGNLKGVKGSPGKVIYKNEKHFRSFL